MNILCYISIVLYDIMLFKVYIVDNIDIIVIWSNNSILFFEGFRPHAST